MRWPLRNQIFFPFAALVTGSVILVTIVSAWVAAENSRQQKIRHMTSVVAALGDASFPLSQSVVERIAGMIDGEVIVINHAGIVTAATVPQADQIVAAVDLPMTDNASPQRIRQGNQDFLLTVVSQSTVSNPGRILILVPEADWLALQRSSIIPPLIVAAITLLIALVLALLLSGRIGSRVHRLRDLFDELARGRFQTVSIDGRDDELRELLTSANELSQQLNRLQEELRRTERLELLGQLSGGLAHQLRNSITGAKVAIQLHQKASGGGEDDLIATAIAQLRLTEEQVQAVLSLRPDSAPPSERESVNLSVLLHEICDLLRPHCLHWRSELCTTGIGENLQLSLVSPSSLKGALLNLVMNGIEAAGIDGRVEIRAERGDDVFAVEIRDTGSGFAVPGKELLEAFRTTKPDGIGLGLTIAHHAVEQESGRLEMRRENNWTVVRLELPAASLNEMNTAP